ncbi:hypothetical protein [Parasphingopyxis sp.]|uniref:hypothetical protein n=1 Tax=Parasphingopyxis sp. TaxID=1920299 RepID=UPI00261A247E|nr:hypothetical protein [Parasphingopyxis sp.]
MDWGQWDNKRVAKMLAGVAVLLLIMYWYRLANVGEFHLSIGEWEEIETAGWMESHQTIIAPNQPVTVTFGLQRRYNFGTVLSYEAEHGPDSLSVRSEFSPTVTRDGEGNWQPINFEEIVQIQGRSTPGFVRLTFTSDRLQMIRTGFGTYRYGISIPPSHGYQENLCYGSQCQPPIQRLSSLDSSADIVAGARWGLFWAFLIGALAVVVYIGPIKVLVTVFPSETVRRVRAGLNTGNAFFSPASNPIRREQDLEELQRLLNEAKAEKDRLADIEQRQKAEQSKDDVLMEEYEAAVARVTELSEEVERSMQEKSDR